MPEILFCLVATCLVETFVLLLNHTYFETHIFLIIVVFSKKIRNIKIRNIKMSMTRASEVLWRLRNNCSVYVSYFWSPCILFWIYLGSFILLVVVVKFLNTSTNFMLSVPLNIPFCGAKRGGWQEFFWCGSFLLLWAAC